MQVSFLKPMRVLKLRYFGNNSGSSGVRRRSKKTLRDYLVGFLTPCDFTPKNQLKTLRLRASWISLMILPHMILS